MLVRLSAFITKGDNVMRLLSAILTLLMTASVAYAQQQTLLSIPSVEESGARGDMWLMLWISLGFIAAIVGVYMFLKQIGEKNL